MGMSVKYDNECIMTAGRGEKCSLYIPGVRQEGLSNERLVVEIFNIFGPSTFDPVG